MSRGAIGQLAMAFAYTRNAWRQPFPFAYGRPLPFSTSASSRERGRIIFLGTPQVSALVLQELLQAADGPDSNFEVTAVVSRPSSRQWLERLRERERQAAAAAVGAVGIGPGVATASSSVDAASKYSGGNKKVDSQDSQHQQLHSSPPPSPPNWARHGVSAVEQLAWDHGFPSDRILCPVSAKDPDFLDAIRRLRPDLAITAAYGSMLPQAFLDIPKYGTLNIHPSLLPKYRGPAPVTRALQDGCSLMGVCLVFTVLKCDAGPVLEQHQVRVDSDIQAPELTEHMFKLGAQMLLRQLPGLLSGKVTARDAVPQDEASSSYAPKVSKLEGLMDFRHTAQQCHDLVRAMAGWPGSRATLLGLNKTTGVLEPIELRVLRTRIVYGPHTGPGAVIPGPAATVAPQTSGSTASAGSMSVPAEPAMQLPDGTRARVLYTATGELLVPCGDGNMLSILQVARRRAGNTGGASQFSPLRNYLNAKEFMDGLGKRLLFVPV